MTQFVCSFDGNYSPETIEQICATFSVTPMIARMLLRRGLTETEQMQHFLYPSVQDITKADAVTGLSLATDRIFSAIEKGEKICVYGDYDADGICATTILMRCFTQLGADVFYFIPSRQRDGYGMHTNTVDAVISRGASLIVTVDNGIGALEETAYCNTKGVDVIVTDHHIAGEKLPEAYAVVTNRPGEKLCGAGVALHLAHALLPDEDISGWLPLAAVATVADVVPLVKENRSIVALGLRKIRSIPGLCALLDIAGATERIPSATTVAFSAIPRLNAAGRIADAMTGVELLLADGERAVEKAKQLNDWNIERKEQEERISKTAERMLAELDVQRRRAIVLAGDDWNPGVIGIVASRLCERYNMPVLLFSKQGDTYSGSGRSIPGVNLYEALAAFSDRFVRFGGHAGAAGVTIQKDAFAAFATDFCAHIAAQYPQALFEPKVRYEEEIELCEFSPEMIDALALLAPFGEANPEPVFLLRDAVLSDVRYIGKGQRHLSAIVAQGEKSCRMVAFSQGEQYASFSGAGSWNMVVLPVVNRYLGRESVEMQLIRAQRETIYGLSLEKYNAILEKVLYNEMYVSDSEEDEELVKGMYSGFPTEVDAVRGLYSAVRQKIGDGLVRDTMFFSFCREELLSLPIFLELGFIGYRRKEESFLCNLDPPKRDISESVLYRMAQSIRQ